MTKVNVHYFQLSITHYNSINALKIRQKYGLGGYGLYVAIIQILASAPNRRLSLLDIPQVAYQLRLGEDDKALRDIIETCFQLTPDNYFYSVELEESVISLIKKVSNLNPSAAGKASAEARKKKQLDEINRNFDSQDTGDLRDSIEVKDLPDRKDREDK